LSNPYKAIFAAPGAMGFAAAAFVARLPVAMAPIGIVTMLSQSHGEYWLAGAVAATFTLANAIAAPQISRLVDRLGQSRLLIPTTAFSAVAFTLLMIATHQKWPAWTLFVAALCAASMPSISAMVRARWTELFRDRPQLKTAFAFESAADELVYIAGASLSVALSVTLFAEAGVLVSTLFLSLGTAAFVLQRRTEPPLRRSESAARKAAISLRPVQLVTLVMVFMGGLYYIGYFQDWEEADCQGYPVQGVASPSGRLRAEQEQEACRSTDQLRTKVTIAARPSAGRYRIAASHPLTGAADGCSVDSEVFWPLNSFAYRRG